MLIFETNFKEVFSSDNIPYFPEANVSFICNLSKANEKGTHFIAVYICKKHIIYFDPFGVVCYVQDILNYLQSYGRKIIQSLVTIQDAQSLHCGYFCIGFVLALNNYYSLSMYQNMFTIRNLHMNDTIICNFILSMI